VHPGSLIQLYITLFSAQPLINVYIDINSPFKVVTGSTVSSSCRPASYTAVAAVQAPLDARPGYYRTPNGPVYFLVPSRDAYVINMDIATAMFISALAPILIAKEVLGRDITHSK
jgi:hypothetical protein